MTGPARQQISPARGTPARSSHPQVSICIISYNTCSLTLTCLRSLFAETTKHTFEVLVVDNCSTDGSAQAIAAEFGSQVHLISSSENLGFAAANNRAAALAAGDLLLLLNPDTIVRDGAIDTLIDFSLRHSESRIWGGRTIFADGRLNPTSCWGRISLWSLLCQSLGWSTAFKRSTLLNPEGIGGWNRDTVRKVDIVSGCFLLIDRSLWHDLEGFAPEFFMYGEDADLCLRAKEYGAQPLICPDATIVHLGGQSERVRPDKIVRLYRARTQLVAKYFSPHTRLLARLFIQANVLRRWALWTVVGTVNRASDTPNRLVFAEVWRRRHEWLSEGSK